MRQGETAPDFELPDQNGKRVRLSDLLANGPVALFFYPAAMSPGCTKEACHFRDLAAEFAAAGVQRIGISGDATDKQAKFAGKHDLDFPLLADVGGSVADLYGVRRGGLLGMVGLTSKRVTFAIGTDGVIADVIKSETDMSTHADGALAALGQPSA